jgi:hypothetical protein
VLVNTIFARAIDACFVRLGTTAVFTPDGGDSVTVRVISKRPDEIVGFGDTRIHTETAVFDMRVSEVGTPRPGDRLTVEGTEYVVQGEPVRDPERLVWTVETYLA